MNIALGGAALDACPDYDANASGGVGVEELIAAVNDALQGCPGAPTPTRPATPTPAVSAAPTPTWTLAPGPPITFFGVTSADDSLQDPTGVGPNGVPIYERPFGFGFTLVVEAKGIFESSGQHPGRTFCDRRCTRPADPERPRSRQRQRGGLRHRATTSSAVSRASIRRSSKIRAMADALNDFGCRFTNGQGGQTGRSCGEACLRFDDGEFHCKSEDTTAQFCAQVDTPMAFSAGDTLLTVRARNVHGELGPPAQIIIRIP